MSNIRTFDQYQMEATRSAEEFTESWDAVTCFSMGAAGEAGELANKVKKIVFHGHPFDKNILLEEIGDNLWYLAALCEVLEVPLAEVASRNIDKLHRRYPNGFSAEDSVNRSE